MNDIKLQSPEGTHPLDENLRPLKVGDRTAPLELSDTDVKVNNLQVGGALKGDIAVGSTDNYFRIRLGTSGATTLSTTDDAGTKAGHFTLNIDGAISMVSVGGQFIVK